MVKVGITGGIGSGKTTFCKEWERLGAFVLYSDDFAKELMQSNMVLKKLIKQTFGAKSYDKKGMLNRAYLAKEAFEKGRIQELNDLVHPILRKQTALLAKQKEKEGVDIFANEAAVLLNNGRPEYLDYVILILADEDKRIDRTSSRDGSDYKTVSQRMDKQPNYEKLIHLADFIVYNDGSVSELKTKAIEIYNELKAIA